MSQHIKLEPPSPPGVTVNIGITGHRDLPDKDDNLLENQLKKIFDEVRNQTKLIAKESIFHPKENPEFYLLSPLAVGSDRIAAKIALQIGFKLQCPLPFNKIRYKEDFPSEHLKKEFEDLLDNAKDNTFEIDFDFSSDSKAYLNVGEIILGHSDILIAIWDGTENEKIGGTGDIVSRAIAQNIPVLWVYSKSPHQIELKYEGLNINKWQHEVGTILKSLLLPEKDVLNFHKIYLKEPCPKWWLSFFQPLFLHLLSEGILKKTNLRNNRHAKNAQSEWEAISKKSSNLKNFANKYYKPYFEWLDYLSSINADLYRSAGILRHINYFLATIGLGIGFYYGFWFKSGGESDLFVLAIRELGFALQAIFLMLIFRIAQKNKSNNWHQKFIDFRILTEMLRQTIFLVQYGSGLHGINLPVYIQRENISWINWYYRAIIRKAGLPNISPSKTLLHDLKGMTLDVIENQIKYHKKNKLKYEKIARKLKNFSNINLKIAIGVIIMRVIVFLLQFIKIDLLNDDFVKFLVKSSNVLCLIFPALSAAAAAILVQGGYDLLAHRSEAMFEDLLKLKDKFKNNMNYPPLKQISYEAAMLMISEVSDWRLFVKTKPVKM